MRTLLFWKNKAVKKYLSPHFSQSLAHIIKPIEITSFPSPQKEYIHIHKLDRICQDLYNNLEQNFKLEEQERQMSDQMNRQEREEQRTRAFNPNEHVMQLKSRDGSKDYLPVQWRLVWFREMCPQGTIDTEEIEVDLDREMEEEAFAWNAEKRRSEKVIKRAKGYARFRAIVTDGKGGRATGTKSECAASFRGLHRESRDRRYRPCPGRFRLRHPVCPRI